MQLNSFPVHIWLAILATILGAHESKQRTLITRRHAEANEETNESSSKSFGNGWAIGELLLPSPFIVLLTSDTVSVAQLPMIENGTLTDIYKLEPSLGEFQLDEQLDERESGRSLEREEDEPGVEGEEPEGEEAERESEEETRLRRRQPAASVAADGRDGGEHEQQMPPPPPPMLVVNVSQTLTSASLGKSEWQQIGSAAAAGRAEEAGPRATPSANTDRKEEEAGREAGVEKSGPRRRRRSSSSRSRRHARARHRRGNSLSEDDDGSATQNERPTQAPTNNQPEEDGIRVNRAEVLSSANSGLRNVTSAQSGAVAAVGHEHKRLEEADPQRGPTSPAEDEHHANYQHEEQASKRSARNGLAISSSSAHHQSASTNSQPQALANTAERVQFCDFDLHMSLGYAFVADSTGRIHRFKLPTGSHNPRANETATTSRDAQLGATNSTQEEPLASSGAGENDFNNNIETGAKILHSTLSYASAHQLNLAAEPIAASAATAAADSSGAENSLRAATNDDNDPERADNDHQHDGNKLARPNGRNMAHSAVEQLADAERQHPRASVGPTLSRTESASSVSLGAPTSDSAATIAALEQQPNKIIWTRNKFRVASSRASGTVLTSRRHAENLSAQQLAAAAAAERASPIRGDRPLEAHQMVGDGGAKHQEQQAAVEPLAAVTEANSRQFVVGTQSWPQGSSKRRSHELDERSINKRKTRIAVDWLSNLLFVLDKYRLLVVDLDGNNELVLIDDFDAITRPLDIKVDPVNNFLFWLQAGRFYNTIYKLDLSVLSMRTATHRLIGNSLRLRQRNNNDLSDLVALISRHYAHPIITNLPPNTKLFTIDHKNSRIYVPFASRAAVESSTSTQSSSSSSSGGFVDAPPNADAEIFARSDETITHLNHTDTANCTGGGSSESGQWAAGGQIMAYNLDGTDVGPLRAATELPNLEAISDFSLDTANNLLYWLSGDGKELFEEYKATSSRHLAQHNLDGRNYTQLMHFDNVASNQPTAKVPRYNIRSIIRTLASSLAPNRLTRSGANEQYESLNIRQDPDSMIRFSKNAPYIILAVTCLIVLLVYLIYTLIYQQIHARAELANAHTRDGSVVSGGSVINSSLDGGEPFSSSRWSQRDANIGQFGGASTRSGQANNNAHSDNSTNLENSIYNTSNAVDEHYRDSQTRDLQTNYCDQSSSRLADIKAWPNRTLDVFNELYVPSELLQDETLASIRRIPIDNLEIETRTLLGEGHFGTVLQGKITHFKGDPRNGTASVSSGHGSSSSGEFTTADCVSDSNSDYLTPRNLLTTDYNCQSQQQQTKLIRLETTTIRVAIKRLRDNARLEEKRDFLQEAKLLAQFNHPNIVQLMGICMDRGSTLIVMELMLGGDLIRYMRENTPKSLGSNQDELNYEDLMKICLDIVNGCCYLEDLDYIHRDLAARNCLVSSKKREERIVKLADFGLARDIYKDSYYKKLNDSAMPLKWMAPECLIEQKFTKKSDVWSFGVVMWEVMNYCQKKPYDGLEPFFMKNHLERGSRLDKPQGCHDDVYKLMTQCWQFEPELRPSFNECRSILIQIMDSMNI